MYAVTAGLLVILIGLGLGLERRRASWLVLVIVMFAACARRAPAPAHPTNVYRGMASWYDEPQMTASGERFNPNALTAAHRTLPFGTRVRVINTRNGRSVIVRINDRGPYSHKRIIDLSKAAARQLGMIDAGVAPVEIEVLGR